MEFELNFSWADKRYLDLRKLTGDQFGKAAILALEYLPDILQITDARFTCAKHTFLLDLRKEIF